MDTKVCHSLHRLCYDLLSDGVILLSVLKEHFKKLGVRRELVEFAISAIPQKYQNTRVTAKELVDFFGQVRLHL